MKEDEGRCRQVLACWHAGAHLGNGRSEQAGAYNLGQASRDLRRLKFNAVRSLTLTAAVGLIVATSFTGGIWGKRNGMHISMPFQNIIVQQPFQYPSVQQVLALLRSSTVSPTSFSAMTCIFLAHHDRRYILYAIRAGDDASIRMGKETRTSSFMSP